jgi:hypothetical protein
VGFVALAITLTALRTPWPTAGPDAGPHHRCGADQEVLMEHFPEKWPSTWPKKHIGDKCDQEISE